MIKKHRHDKKKIDKTVMIKLFLIKENLWVHYNNIQP